MKRRMIAFILTVISATGLSLSAQDQPQTLTLTVDEAVDYALDHNRSVASARYDLLASEKAVWEAIAAGLPSVDGTISMTNNLIIPVMIFNGMSFKVGTDFEYSNGISASTAVFNAPYLVGIQTAKLARSITQKGLTQTEEDTKESVKTTYYLILVSHQTLNVLEQNITNLEEILASTKAMYSVGMAEATDVDQMQSSVTTLRNTRASMQRSIEVNYNMLRFLLGVDRETQIILSEVLDEVLAKVVIETVLDDSFNIEENIAYQMVDGQVKLSELSLKGVKSSVLPSIGAAYSYSRAGRGDELESLSFANGSYVALQLRVPIFASGLRHTNIQKAKINLDKANNTRMMVSDQLLMQEKQLRYNLVSANEQYVSQKENIQIAERVLKSYENKYNQGMASSLDLTQANNSYLTAQNNYISALMNLLQTKVAFDKLMNKL
ncbi:MAG: TolC family protein [Bacteroidales bacterium]